MIRLLILLLLPLSALAQEESWQPGEVLNHMLSICVSKESAIAIVEADVKGGHGGAQEAFDKKTDCSTVPVQGYQVGRVVHHAKIKREKEITLSVVEIVDEHGKVLAYFLTTLPVVAKLTVEPKRGSNS